MSQLTLQLDILEEAVRQVLPQRTLAVPTLSKTKLLLLLIFTRSPQSLKGSDIGQRLERTLDIGHNIFYPSIYHIVRLASLFCLFFFAGKSAVFLRFIDSSQSERERLLKEWNILCETTSYFVEGLMQLMNDK